MLPSDLLDLQGRSSWCWTDDDSIFWYRDLRKTSIQPYLWSRCVSPLYIEDGWRTIHSLIIITYIFYFKNLRKHKAHNTALSFVLKYTQSPENLAFDDLFVLKWWRFNAIGRNIVPASTHLSVEDECKKNLHYTIDSGKKLCLNIQYREKDKKSWLQLHKNYILMSILMNPI